MKFKQRLKARGYPENIIKRSLTGVNFASRQSALTHTQKPLLKKRLLPIVTMYHLKTNIDGTLEFDTQSSLTENNFYKTSDHLLQKSLNPLKKCFRKQKYNLKAIMRRDHKSYIGSPSRSVFTFIPKKKCATCTTA